jgi:hypothetical protein
VTALLLGIGLAQAGGPGSLGLVPEAPEIVAAYAAKAKAEGRTGPATRVDCRPAFDGLLFCLTSVQQGRWTYANQANLDEWGLSSAEAHSRAAQDLRRLPLADRLSPQSVEGVPGSYRAGQLDDGREASVLLAPEDLARLLGGPPVVAVPAQGAVIAWVPGNPLLDKVVAVGVRKMFDASKHPVSSRIYRWTPDGWQVWGEAKKPEP